MLTAIDNQLFGLDDSSLHHFSDDDGRQLWLDADALSAFQQMKHAAQQDGVQLNICSAFRDFERQCQIWNNKASGKRKVLDAASQPVDISHFSDQQRLDTLLLWSAIPAMSRHHWGTDVDLFDASAISRNELQLTNREYESGGPCYSMFCWLEQHATSFGFYRPFQQGLSGTSAELWHYSYFPTASRLQAQYDTEKLKQLLANSDVALKQTILSQLEQLVTTFVQTVAPAPSRAGL
ncbi:M15 family metallopeptidase [Shewanella sp.]|uniref:M15 family metallopeptidase n=1 Tax=Shewanella sp. TaxID=50422 RepID=UPI003A987C67